MKKSSLVLFLNAILAHSSYAIEIVKLAEFEYMHCSVQSAPADQAVTHYVIDVRDPDQYKLYSAQGAASLNMMQLKLRLIDERLQQSGTDGYDLVWKSGARALEFKLQIHDDGGQILSGQLVSGGKTSDIGCIDASLED